jgi:hypothetical protein
MQKKHFKEAQTIAAKERLQSKDGLRDAIRGLVSGHSWLGLTHLLMEQPAPQRGPTLAMYWVNGRTMLNCDPPPTLQPP